MALLVGPIRRLRAGVERLSAGDLAARVPPTSSDEVGELTRAFNEMGESLQQKERIQRAFGRYASDYVLNSLLETPEGTELAGAEREITILFVDVRGFTRLSEGLKARDVVALLNDVFQLVSDGILERGGTLDKFIGDSVMAYFGAPIPSADHAVQAVSAAVDIMRANAARNRVVAAGRARRRARDRHPHRRGGGGQHRLRPPHRLHRDRRRRERGRAAREAREAGRDPRDRGGAAPRARRRTALRFEGERQLSGRVEPVHVYAVELSEESDTPARNERSA